MERRSILTIFRQAAASLFLFAFAAVAAHAQRPVMTTHVPEEVTSGAAPRVGHLSGDERLSLALSLPIRNQAELDDLLQQLYDPHSPSYHQYLSVEEFTERFGPTAADYAAIRQFAEENELTEIDTFGNRMVLDVEAPASKIESAFHVTLGVYQHPTEARTFYAPDREPTPDLNVALLHISGMDNVSLPTPKYINDATAQRNTTGSGPSGSFLGSDLRAAYYGSGSLNGAGQIVGIFAFKGYEMSDIDNYFNNAGEPLNVPIVAISVNGASKTCPPPSCNDGEQSLDIEQAISMAPGLSQLSFYVGSSDVSVFNKMASDNTSKSISCSYGWKDNESSLDSIFEEMQTQGQTVFIATGDNGSSTPANVVWPSDDPYITAVGGTVLTTNGAGGSWKSETGWDNSAGMPSPNGVPIPSWQQGSGIITTSNKGSTTLRNIPDVSSESNASQYVCYQGLCATHGGGTSYAAPLWAGLIAMANEQAASNGEATVGFINPTIYGFGTGSGFTSDFHDVTSGSNGKYSAVVDFDLVTGWGSPQGVNLINALAPASNKGK
jgi:subtilase family serine protease